jgi:hypothetical protein
MNIIDDTGLAGLKEILLNTRPKRLKEINLRRNYISKSFIGNFSSDLKNAGFEGRLLLEDQISKPPNTVLENEERYFDSKDDVDFQIKEAWVKRQPPVPIIYF